MFDTTENCTCTGVQNIHTEISDSGTISICDTCHKPIEGSFKAFTQYVVTTNVPKETV